jgi:CubicO group peptidase (beta-lactamase class C family)
VARAAAADESARRRLLPLSSRPRRAASLALLALFFPACGGGGNDDGTSVAVDRTNVWSRADPADAGIDEAALERIDDRIPAEFSNVRSLLVARDGRLVFERYYGGAAADRVFDVYSVTKSLVSALVGIAIADGRLESVDQRLVEVLPGYPSAPGLRQVTLGDLLTMRAGFSGKPIATSDNWVRTLMARSRTSRERYSCTTVAARICSRRC